MLYEFLGIQQEYEDLAGGAEAISADDELYGKILGTLGQACGFLRARDQAAGAEAFAYLERSKGYFEHSRPLYRGMNLGYRLTDLWDRDELDEAERLMADERLPTAAGADPFSLLHRLRVAASRAHRDRSREGSDALLGRLCKLVDDPEVPGRTPWDLCLKWALFLEPGDAELRRAAERWLDHLDERQPALVATSLPLAMMIGRPDVARRHLERLLEYPGFESHWSTDRCASLRDCIDRRGEPGFDALRAMPWNYA